jgi:hypothetical protein
MHILALGLLVALLDAGNSAGAERCGAFRCSCVPASAMGLTEAQLELRQRDRAAAVLLGTVVRIDTLPSAAVRKDAGERAAGPVVARLRVERVWKGALADTATVVLQDAPGLRTSCDLAMAVGERYLVFAAAGGPAALRTRQCTGTRRAGAADTALATFGAGRRPRP